MKADDQLLHSLQKKVEDWETDIAGYYNYGERERCYAKGLEEAIEYLKSILEETQELEEET